MQPWEYHPHPLAPATSVVSLPPLLPSLIRSAPLNVMATQRQSDVGLAGVVLCGEHDRSEDIGDWCWVLGAWCIGRRRRGGGGDMGSENEVGIHVFT